MSPMCQIMDSIFVLAGGVVIGPAPRGIFEVLCSKLNLGRVQTVLLGYPSPGLVFPLHSWPTLDVPYFHYLGYQLIQIAPFCTFVHMQASGLGKLQETWLMPDGVIINGFPD